MRPPFNMEEAVDKELHDKIAIGETVARGLASSDTKTDNHLAS